MIILKELNDLKKKDIDCSYEHVCELTDSLPIPYNTFFNYMKKAKYGKIDINNLVVHPSKVSTSDIILVILTGDNKLLLVNGHDTYLRKKSLGDKYSEGYVVHIPEFQKSKVEKGYVFFNYKKEEVTSSAISTEHPGQSPDRPLDKKDLELVDIFQKE